MYFITNVIINGAVKRQNFHRVLLCAETERRNWFVIRWIHNLIKAEPKGSWKEKSPRFGGWGGGGNVALSCMARRLFFSCRQLKRAALHLHVYARPAPLTSAHLGTGPAVQPALNEGLCVNKEGWLAYMAIRLKQFWKDQGICLFLQPPFLSLLQIPYF